MSEPSVWYAIYSSSAFSTVFMTQEELDEALKIYPQAQSQSFQSFEDACAWLGEVQSAGTSDRNASTGCIRTEKEKPHNDSPYKRPAPSVSIDDESGPSSQSSPRRSKPRLSGRSEQSSPAGPSSSFVSFNSSPTVKSKYWAASGSSSRIDSSQQSGDNSFGYGEAESSFQEPDHQVLSTNIQADVGSDEIKLSAEQNHVLEMVLDGENVFFTGSAGTGKSVLLREIIRQLQNEGKNVAVTASTGIAAINIGGKTLHSFAGVGLGNQSADILIKKARNKRTMKRWKRTEVLIIDEISMVDARWFDVLNEIGKTLRNNTRPFGGIQLVVCGDFFQLPPVPEQAYSDVGIPVSFAFEAKCWNEAVPNTITLTKVFRQKQSELVDMLNDMRLGVVSQASADLFSRLSRKVEYNDGIQPTQIYPLRRLADEANKRQMDLLTGEEIKFKALDTFGKDLYGEPITPQKGKSLLDKKVSDSIQLKVGAQVMCIQNLPDCGIVNGSIGVITRFVTPGEAHSIPEVQVAKSTLDRKWKVGDAALPSDPSQWETQKWPVVRYQNGRMVVMTPFPFSHENADGGVEAIRQQVPLILAWALTVHKAQGQTLERVRVDLEGTFEKGQAYVALSRCTTIDGLEVQNFSPAIVFAHPRVIEWARTLAVISDGKASSDPYNSD
ncbi:ATP-dependent DNA helicase PIF1 [Ceratobasidium sp. AG-Ba]|nr:ATP-dependent DNA helicase PIF1 [Ceratobasidium sp. AG-Ba]